MTEAEPKPYYTRLMAAGLPDLVDCTRLAEDAAVIERVYALKELPRLQDLLATPEGDVEARFAFGKAASGRAAVTVVVRAVPQLICQRCLRGFAYPVSGVSDLEFADDELAAEPSEGRELFRAGAGRVSLRELAEEELLLSLPVAAACSVPQRCPNAPGFAAAAPEAAAAGGEAGSGEMRRPFLALGELLKKT